MAPSGDRPRNYGVGASSVTQWQNARMRILRLGNSEDISPGLEDQQRAWYIGARELEAAIGEPVEIVVRPIFPTPDLPQLVRKWIDEAQPDLVFLKVTWYWYGYESVPRRIERLLGRAGKPIAKAGLNAAAKPGLAHNRTFRFGRRMAHRIIGGDTQVPTSQVLRVMEECIRTIIARENIALVVKGTGDGRREEEGLQGYFGRFQKRREEVEGSIERLCKELHVPYTGTRRNQSLPSEKPSADLIHRGASAHERMGRNEAAAMLEAWQAFTADHSAPIAASHH